MLLALELSGARNTLALGTETQIWSADFSSQRGVGLMAAMHNLLAEQKIEKSDLRGILLGLGPGSYTGLRIACSAGIMLGYSLQIPCCGLCSFAAAAFTHCPPGESIHLALNAYRQQVYHACYRRQESDLEELTAPHLCTPQEIAELIGSNCFLGEKKWAPQGVVIQQDCQAHAEDILTYAFSLGFHADGAGFENGLPPEPLYLRPAAFRPKDRIE